MILRDQSGHQLEIPKNPQRIISLVPSQSELLVDLGVGQRLVGVTKFCVHPPDLRSSATVVGGTKTLHFDRVRALNPDLIIGNKEENERAIIEELRNEFPVWLSEIYTLDDSLNMIQALGMITGTGEAAADIIQSIQQKLPPATPQPSLKVLYLIWRNPWMAAGTDTFISNFMELGGFENVVNTTRYPELPDKEIRALDPDVVLLSSEPFPFREKHVQELQQLLPGKQIQLVDGEAFSWYGSRLREGVPYMLNLHQELILNPAFSRSSQK